MAKKQRPTPQPAPFVAGLSDAHTHLASCTVAEEELLQAARAAGVTRICTVGDGLPEARLALETARRQEGVWAACAIHPVRAGELDDAAKAELTAMAFDPNCVAVGETGLDTYWITHAPETTAPLEVQEEALRWHVDVAVASGKALMIHNREADEHLLRVLGDAPQPRVTILHCFSSPMDVARRALDRGYVLSFAGNVTFKRNEELRRIASLAPADQILVETDAPYMTPEPYRGARNSPALVGHTAACLAGVRGVPVAELVAQLAENFDRVYGLVGDTPPSG